MTLTIQSQVSHAATTINTLQASCCNGLGELALRVKNFVSKYFLEPWEYLIFQARSSIGALSWVIKNAQYNDRRASPFGPIKLIDDEFQKTSYFQKLQTLDPHLADPNTRKSRIDVLNNLLKEGTCWGQSLILLNDPNLLRVEHFGNDQLGQEAVYLQTIQMLQIRIDQTISLKQLMAKAGRDPQEFISTSGQIDEAIMFDFIYQQKSKVWRFLIRGMIQMMSPELLAISDGELLAKKVQLSSTVNSHFSSARPVTFQADKFLAKHAAQEELDQKICNFFTKNQGTFVLSSWDKEKKLGHAVFIDNTNEKECRVFDPALSASYKFSDATTGISCMLKFMHALFPTAKTMHHRVSTLSPAYG